VCNQLLSALAGILWLGQIRIVAGTNAQGEQYAVIADEKPLRVAAMLLGCDVADLFDGLCIRCIKAGRYLVSIRYCHYQYCMVYGISREGRGGGHVLRISCAMVLK